jgi:hypothetical protein
MVPLPIVARPVELLGKPAHPTLQLTDLLADLRLDRSQF